MKKIALTLASILVSSVAMAAPPTVPLTQPVTNLLSPTNLVINSQDPKFHVNANLNPNNLHINIISQDPKFHVNVKF